MDKTCGRVRQPPTDTVMPLDGENCIACKDDKALCRKHNLNKYLEALKCRTLCKQYIEPSLEAYQGIVNSGALFYTPSPVLVVPPGQKGFNMVPNPMAFPVAPHYPPIDNPLVLAGRNVLVVGAAKNLGLAIATTLQALGMNVVGTSRFPECYDRSYGYPLLKLDVRCSKNIASFFRDLMSIHFTNGKIDALILLPAQQNLGMLIESNGDDMQDLMDLNVAGLQRVVYHAFPFMRFSNECRVLTFGSVAGELPIGQFDGYAVSKRALQAWNDNHMIEGLQRKAQGVSKAEPTFVLIEPSFIQSTLGLYENYVWKDTDIFDTFTRGRNMVHQALQNATTVMFDILTTEPPIAPPVPQLVADAVVQILRAPQPSVRYLLYPAPPTFNFVPFVQASNILSADEYINLAQGAAAEPLLLNREVALLSQQVLDDAYCNGE